MAMRLWCNQWRAQRRTVRVRSDSVCALSLVLELRGSCYGLRVLASEAALDVSAACYRPVVAEHIPFVANHLAHRLSRRTQPGEKSACPLPPELSVQCSRDQQPGIGPVSRRARFRKGRPRSAKWGVTKQSDDFPCLDVARLTWCLDPSEYGLSLKNVPKVTGCPGPRFCHRLGEQGCLVRMSCEALVSALCWVAGTTCE